MHIHTLPTFYSAEQQLEKSRVVIRNLQSDCDRLNKDMNKEIEERVKRVEIEREEEFAELKRGKVEALTLIQVIVT